MNQLCKVLRVNDFNVRFYTTSTKISQKSLIGNIDISFENLTGSLKKNEYKFKQLSYQPWDFIILENLKQLITCNVNNSITIYDSTDFREIKSINSLNNLQIGPVSITNSNDSIYIADPTYDRIYQTKLDLTYVKHVSSSFDNINKCDNKSFGNPIDVYYHKSKLYICDHKNKNIKVMNDNLVYMNAHDLPYEPRQFKILNKTAIITEASRESIVHIYNLEPNFTVKRRIDNSYATSITEYSVKNQFIAFDDLRKKFCFYNEDGELVEEIDYRTDRIKFRDENNQPPSIKILVNNNQLLLSSCKSKEFLII
jgi:hypothetical protein